MVKQMTLNGNKLREIAHSSPTAEVTMTALALRERHRTFSDITRTKNQLIQKGERIVDNDYMQFWKDLQDAGMGSIVFGRKGKPDRFEWYYSLKSVGKAAIEGSDVPVKSINTQPAVVAKKRGRGRPKGAKNKVKKQNKNELVHLLKEINRKLERFVS